MALRSLRSPRPRKLLCAAGTGPRRRAGRLESDRTAAVGESLEEIFLELTKSENKVDR